MIQTLNTLYNKRSRSNYRELLELSVNRGDVARNRFGGVSDRTDLFAEKIQPTNFLAPIMFQDQKFLACDLFFVRRLPGCRQTGVRLVPVFHLGRTPRY
jgi:hypothetical protein